MTTAAQISQSTAPVIHRLEEIGAGIAAVALVAYVMATALGGTSRPRRKLVFYVCSFVGFVVVLFFIFSRP